MKVTDSADAGRSGYELIASIEKFLDNSCIAPRIAFDESVIRMLLIALLDPPVLREIIQTDNLVPESQKFLDEITGNETRRCRSRGSFVGDRFQIDHVLPFSNTADALRVLRNSTRRKPECVREFAGYGTLCEGCKKICSAR